MTEAKEIKEYPISNYKTLMKTPYIYDGRNCYDLKEVEKAKINYYSIGRRKI